MSELDDVFDEFEEGEKEEDKAKPEPPEKEEKKEAEEHETSEEEAEESAESEEEVSTEEEQEETEPKKEEPKKEKEGRFNVSDDKGEGILTITVYGMKGKGKTTLSFALPGSKYVVSMDRKSYPVKRSLYNDGDITVKNGIRYYDESTGETKLRTANKTYDYIISNDGLLGKGIRELDEKPDWIVFDDSDKIVEICEMRMRYRSGLGPYEGIKNKNIWKKRRDFIRTLHNIASQKAKKGIVYTCFTDEDKVIKDGEFIAREKVPAWFDIIMKRTDVVINVWSEMEEEGMRFYAAIESAKKNGIINFKTGKVADVTDIYENPSAFLKKLRE